MIEKVKVVTNNPLSKKNISNKFEIDFVDGNVKEVFEKVRDYIHKGHILLTHPLMSSVKPNETPYRTIMVSQDSKCKLDMESLTVIEESITSLNKFMKMFNCPNWSDSIKEDFMLIDFDLINNVIK